MSVANSWRSSTILLHSDAGAATTLKDLLSCERTFGCSTLVPLTRQQLEDSNAVDPKAKKKKQAVVPLPQLLQNWIKKDEEDARNKTNPANNDIPYPDVIYLLSDYPSTTEEMEQLVRGTDGSCSVDGVVQLVSRVEPAAPANSASQQQNGDEEEEVENSVSVAAFGSLPLLEQARAAAAANRAVKAAEAKKAATAVERMSAALAAAEESLPLEGEIPEDGEEGDEVAGEGGADHQPLPPTTNTPKKEPKGRKEMVRRKSFELPSPMSKWKGSQPELRIGGVDKSNATPFVKKLVQHASKNSNHAAWADLTFDEIYCNKSEVVAKPLELVCSEVAKLLQQRAVDRANFRTWLASVTLLSVPEVPVAQQRETHLAALDSEAQAFSSLDPLRTTNRADPEMVLTSSHDSAKSPAAAAAAGAEDTSASSAVTPSGGDGELAKHKPIGDGATGGVESPWSSRPLLNTYARLVSEVPDHNVSAAVLLHCMVQSVALTVEFGVSSDVSSVHDNPASVAHSGGGNGEGEEEEEVLAGPLGPGLISLDHGDSCGLRVALTELLLADDPEPHLTREKLCSRLVVGVERKAFQAMQMPRVNGYGALPLLPQLSAHERSVERSELLTFTSLSPKDVDIARQVHRFENMLNKRYTLETVKNFNVWSLKTRTLMERLPAHVFKQVLAKESESSPEVLRYYDRATDQLLIALYHPTARHRCGEIVWNATESVNARTPFPQWSAPTSAADFSPRTREGMRGILDVRREDLEKTSTITTKLFPSDHGLIVLNRFQSSPIAWLSCFKDKHVFGLRASSTALKRVGHGSGKGSRGANHAAALTPASPYVANFVCEFEDGLRVVGKEGTNHPTKNTVSLSLTAPTGQLVTVNSDGVVHIRYVTVSKVGVPASAREEEERSITGKGTVTRLLRDGSTEIFLADGTTLRREARASHFILTKVNGSRFRVKLAPNSDRAAAAAAAAAADSQRGVNNSTSSSSNSKAGAGGGGKRKGAASDHAQNRHSSSPSLAEAQAGDLADGSSSSPLVVEELLSVPSSVETDPETMARVFTVSNAAPMSAWDTNTAATSSFEASIGGDSSNNNPTTGSADQQQTSGGAAASSGGSTVLVKFSDGSTLARFRDGTSIRTSPSREHVLVENAFSYPAVWRDCAVDQTASKHARGEKVPVATGGERLRMRMALPDGTKVACTYNTRVTSEVRGKVVVQRPDLAEIVATDSPQVDSCKILFKPRGVWKSGGALARVPVGDPSEPSASSPTAQDGTGQSDNDKDNEAGGKRQSTGDEASNSSDERGVYQFNLYHGRLVLEDTEQNVFYASVNPEKVEKNEKGATYDVDLAGKIEGDDDGRAEAVVNDPMPPRLFVMNRDGSALEMLRPADTEGFSRQTKLGSIMTSPAEKLMGDPLDAPGKQHVHHRVIERPRVSLFANAYPSSLHTPWHVCALPVCARTAAVDQPRAPPHVIAPRIVIRRVWYEVSMLDEVGQARLRADLNKCASFRSSREQSVNRFAVEDDRSEAELEAERYIQNKLQRAMKAVKAKRKALLNKSLESEAKAAAAAAAAAAESEEEEDADDSEESEDESVDEAAETSAREATFYSEVEAAFLQRMQESVDGAHKWIAPEDVASALVQVCNQVFSDEQCSNLLRSVPNRTWAVGGTNAQRVSFDDLLTAARTASSTQYQQDMAGQGTKSARKLAHQRGEQQQPNMHTKASTTTFWDTNTGALAMEEMSKGAAGGGFAAARQRKTKGSRHQTAESVQKGSPSSEKGSAPLAASTQSDTAAPTFTLDLESTPGLSVVDASCWTLFMGSVAQGSEAETTVWLRNVSPFAARFRCVKRGAKGIARLSAQAKQGPVASGAMVPLRVVFRCDDSGESEDTVTVVSEHQELRMIVQAQAFRTKALHR